MGIVRTISDVRISHHAHMGCTGAKRDIELFDFADTRVVTQIEAGMRLAGASAALPCIRHA
jgi:hypothetical protein